MSTSNVRNRFRMSALSAAVLSVCSGHAFAQESGDESQYEALEEVQVTGLRASIEKSIDDKRFGGNIKDTINAEDIGKTTDQNIAEALSRVTGVSMQTADGEGTTITVRGANAQQNNISLNGVQLGSTGFSQAVDLSAYSADILSKIEVVKTPSADHDEGSLGANINLVSNKPLEVSEGFNINGQGRYNDLSEKENHKVSTTYTGKFFDDTVGVIVTAFDETNSVRKDQFAQENWISRTSQRATDQNGNVVNDVTGLVPYNTKMQLHQNDRDRQGVNLGVQWAATDATEVNANVSWNKQEIDSTMHEVKTRAGDFWTYNNMVEGEDYLWTGPAAWTDPQEEWHTYNSDTRTFTKYLNRSALGDLSQAENKFTNENRIFSLDVNHELNDAVVISGGLNYSKAEEIPDQALYVNMQNYRRVNAWLTRFAPPGEAEPVGYDCTSGSCNLVAGEGFVDYGAVLHPDPNALWDNSSTTGFNPDDLAAQHVSFLSRTVREVSDTQQAAYFDVDWDVDFAGVHKLEFGAKATSREKYVDNQTGQFNSIGEGVIIADPDTGQTYTIVEGITDIDGTFVTNGDLGVDDFMQSLGYDRNNVTDGWQTVSAQRAFEVALNNPAAEFIPDDTETRSADLDTQALYFKANFSFLDEALSGDVGLRYVNTTVDTTGYSGVNFHSSTGNLGRVLDAFTLRGLRDSSNPACAPVRDYGNAIEIDDPATPDIDENTIDGDPQNQEELRWSRVDGLGWDTQGTADRSDDTPIADQGACFEEFAVRGNMNEYMLWRHSDVSTESNYIYGARDADGNPIVEDRSLRSFAVTGEHEYNVLLPSLNLNYIFNDEMVGRLAVSKTMSRPQIDSLRPGFKVSETVWTDENGTGNAITLTNTKLDPLESNNLDLSFEWYFAENSLVAAGLFYKDMTNFEESQTIVTYMDDLRDLGLDENGAPYDTAELIKSADDLEGCMPRRIEGVAEYDEDWLHSDELTDLCAKFQTTSITNGKGAEILGAELQYTQTYDMLPGVFAGLGTMFNYTYQDSAYEQEVSSLDPSLLLPELPVAYTPEHSYNATVFWEMNGHQLRLAYQGTSDQLARRVWDNGSLWQEGRGTLDLSASYALNDNVTLSFNAVNLTDEGVRHYYTSRFIQLPDENGNLVAFDEGNPLDGGFKGRTAEEYKTGTFYRLGVQARF
ncbi:TonB-dependent receptor [Microbulbifer agarilyticus]